MELPSNAIRTKIKGISHESILASLLMLEQE
jgi:hypothetical protein